MAAITRSALMEYASGQPKARAAEPLRKSIRTAALASVFLSHSHSDREIVEPTANFLASLGVEVYVDWLDPTMPSVTNADTATRIRDMIRSNRRFLLLATQRSLDSRWVPWELGYADGIKQIADLAVLSVSESLVRDAPNEYVQVYQRIRQGKDENWYVFRPGEDRSSLTVQDWLMQP